MVGRKGIYPGVQDLKRHIFLEMIWEQKELAITIFDNIYII